LKQYLHFFDLAIFSSSRPESEKTFLAVSDFFHPRGVGGGEPMLTERRSSRGRGFTSAGSWGEPTLAERAGFYIRGELGGAHTRREESRREFSQRVVLTPSGERQLADGSQN